MRGLTRDRVRRACVVVLEMCVGCVSAVCPVASASLAGAGVGSSAERRERALMSLATRIL